MATSAKFLPGNRLTLLNSGAEFFPALLTAINQASQEVHLESYIFEADRTGREVAGALISAARRGVSLSTQLAGIDTHRETHNLSSAIRLFVLDYFRVRAISAVMIGERQGMHAPIAPD